MILWATELLARNGCTAAEFLELARAWLKGSPHLPWSQQEVPDPGDGEIATVEHEGQVAQVARVQREGEAWAGLRHTWVEGASREWTTELVGWESGHGLMTSVRVDCNLLTPQLQYTTSRKPYAIKLLFQSMGGAEDGRLRVVDHPHNLTEIDVDLASAIVRGRAACRLPIVYVSAPFRDVPAVSARRLARALSGLAHTVVEPSKYFSFALARAVDGRNPHGGGVGIFWPSRASTDVRLLPARQQSERDFEATIEQYVRETLAFMRPTPQLTWGHLAGLIYKRRLESIKADRSLDVAKYAAEFDVELREKDKQVQEREAEIGRLRAELQRYVAATSRGGDSIRAKGEKEYYPGEHRDAVLGAIELALQALGGESRRAHILKDILQVSNSTGLAEEMAAEIKRCFASGSDLGAEERRTLERLGFEVTSDGKHHKATYHGDGRYTFAISKTSSDHRAGKNLASTINKTLFK